MSRRAGARPQALPGGGRLPAVLTGLLLVTVLGQRLALPLPGFQLQLTLVAVLLALGLLLRQRHVRADELRLQLYLLAALCCTLAAFAAAGLAAELGGRQSMPSWMVLLALYLPWVYKLRSRSVDLYQRFALTFVRLMVALAAVGALQLLTQLAGLWTYSDPLGSWVPDGFTIDGYNTSIPLHYGAVVHKANAFVFLEPSFLSQFCALAIVVAVVLRAPAWQVGVLGLGLLSAVSGTGLLLLAVGGALALVRAPQVIRPRLVAIALAGAAAAVASPIGALLLSRRDEFVRSGSSGYKRFVAPYLEVGDGLAQEPLRYVLGAGPGTATRLLESNARGQFGDAVVYNIPTKLVFEYGFLAGGLFTVFIVVALLHRAAVPVVPGAVLFMIFFLSGSLLQPHTVVLAWLLTGIWTGARVAGPPDDRAGPAPPRRAEHSEPARR